MKARIALATFVMVVIAPVLCAAQSSGGVGEMSASTAGGQTSFKVGVLVGGGWGSSHWDDVEYGFLGSHTPSGALTNLRFGVDHQRGALTWGAMAEVGRAWVTGEHRDEAFTNAAAPEYNRGEIDYMGTVAGRLGHTWGALVPYAQAGLAWAHTRYSLLGYYEADREFARISTTRTGYSAGAGVDYALSERLGLVAEYQYLGFGTDRVSLPCMTALSCADMGSVKVTVDVRESIQIVKTGVTLRF